MQALAKTTIHHDAYVEVELAKQDLLGNRYPGPWVADDRSENIGAAR